MDTSIKKNDQTVLIVGGAGYIGSHVNKLLQNRHYRTITFDNLSQGNFSKETSRGTFIKGDIGNNEDLDRVFSNNSIDVVMHFAAFIDVRESVIDPAKYYINNVAKTINLLEAMRRHQVNTIIFSSSAAVYGIPLQTPIDESHPCAPVNPYGETKLIIEKILQDYDRAYGMLSASLRYFNAAGGDPAGKIRNEKVQETNLIPIILRSLQTPESSITIFGTNYPTPDGTCIRDYVHVEDIGSAHILAMQKLLKDRVSTSYNLGSGSGFSVREVIRAVEKITTRKVNVIEGGRREGDPPILVANFQKAKRELGWQPTYSLEDMIAHAWQALQPVIAP